MICMCCGEQLIQNGSGLWCPCCRRHITVGCGITTHPCPECARLRLENELLMVRVHQLEGVAVKAVRHYVAMKKHHAFCDEATALHKALENAGY